MMPAAVRVMGASSRTRAWFFASHRHCTRFPWAAAVAYTCCPTAVEPTKVTPRTSGWVRKISASVREQGTMLKMPSGTPASLYSSAIFRLVMGVVEAGFNTKALPHTMHKGAIQPTGIMAGKFQGAMPANTPMGSRYRVVS